MIKRVKPAGIFRKAVIATVFLSVCALVTGGVAAEGNVLNADQMFDFAENAYERGSYDSAITEFERFVFHYPTDRRAPEAMFYTGMSYFNQGRYNQAVETFESLVRRYDDNDYAIEALFMAAESDRRQNNHSGALFRLSMLTREDVDPDIKDRALYGIGWLLLEQRDHASARRALTEISEDRRDVYQLDYLLNRLDDIETLPTKSPTAAGIFAIIPGGGYLYTERYRDAWVSFLFTTAFAGAAYESFDNHLYFMGSILSFVAAGFYSGSIYGSVGAAHKYNRDTYDEFVTDLRQGMPEPSNRPFLGLQFQPKGLALTLNFRF